MVEIEAGPCFVASSGIVLVACGIACLGSSYYAQSMLSDSFDTACAALSSADGCLSQVLTGECRGACTGRGLLKYEEDECYAACTRNRDGVGFYSPDQCQIDIKREGGCVCATMEADDCDCR